jgi:hypothetical protein
LSIRNLYHIFQLRFKIMINIVSGPVLKVSEPPESLLVSIVYVKITSKVKTAIGFLFYLSEISEIVSPCAIKYGEKIN